MLILSGFSILPGLGNPDNPPTPPPEQATLETVCLSDKIAKNGINPENVRVPTVLKNIKKANNTNTQEGYEIDKCKNAGNCGGPDSADYILVASNVKINHIVYPNSYQPDNPKSDRQFVNQFNPTDDPILTDRYKNRIYRSFCGDWCYTCPPDKVVCEDAEGMKCECSVKGESVVLPYRGSFHCDFVFYLQDEDGNGAQQLDEFGKLLATNEKDPQLPADNSLFSVYFRKGATLPDNIKCKKKAEINQDGFLSSLFGVKKAFAQNNSSGTINYPENSKTSWLWLANKNKSDGSFTARNTQILTDEFKKFPIGSSTNVITDPLRLKGRFEVYKNLLDPIKDDYLYLVQEGKVAEMENALANPSTPQTFSYFLFRLTDSTSFGQKSLKLGKFKPITRTWINKWAEESKPAIYIYPPEKVDLTVKLHTKGKITVSDPLYDPEMGWKITAYPDGTIRKCDNETMIQCFNYPYLYYEANLKDVSQTNEGKVIRAEDLKKYLSSELTKLGLNMKEKEDFLEYWIPRLEKVNAPYFFIRRMENHDIENLEPLEISAHIDTSLRIRFYFKPLDYPLSVPPQPQSTVPIRNGFAVVEWGGILDQE